MKFFPLKSILLALILGDSVVSVKAQRPVDLGLSVMWADANVGASDSCQYGKYFSWGETSDKHYYGSNFPYVFQVNKKVSKYTPIDNLTTLESSDDVAYIHLGRRWSIPTAEQVKELIENCTWTYISRGMCKGFLVTGPSRKSIFLPLGGYMDWDYRFLAGTEGRYWTSSLDNRKSLDNRNVLNAFQLYIKEGKRTLDSFDRAKGALIRAVYR